MAFALCSANSGERLHAFVVVGVMQTRLKLPLPPYLFSFPSALIWISSSIACDRCERKVRLFC